MRPDATIYGAHYACVYVAIDVANSCALRLTISQWRAIHTLLLDGESHNAQAILLELTLTLFCAIIVVCHHTTLLVAGLLARRGGRSDYHCCE